MKRFRRVSAIVCLALLACLLAQAILPVQSGLMTAQAAKKVKLNKTKAEVYVGKKITLKVLGTNKKVTWSSSNKRVAKVNQKGVVTGVGLGDAKIYAWVGSKKMVGSKKLTCTVSVYLSAHLDGRWGGYLYKPIIYLYPEAETELTVKLGKPENITASYPAYADGWHVSAQPDGMLKDLDTGRSLYALYWEGQAEVAAPMDEGFVVSGADTLTFLEEKLALLGLSEREAEEFIIFWLPQMQDNNYNLIRFESMEEIDSDMPLDFSVKPDTLIRVMMAFKPLDEPIEISEQVLPETPVRNGFTAVEWGGRKVD